MKVNSVTVCNFRNYGDFSVSFDSGINVLCGKNGIGKTNLLEGIFLFAGGKIVPRSEGQGDDTLRLRKCGCQAEF